MSKKIFLKRKDIGKIMNLTLSVILTGSMLCSSAIPSYAAVRDNVGGMDTSVGQDGININPATADKILSGYGAWVDGDLVVGTMPDFTGKTISYPKDNNITIGQDDSGLKSNEYITEDNQNAIIKVPKGYYNQDTKLSIPIETIKNEITSLNSSCYYLGTGTTIDIKSKFPNDYQNFTTDNFVIIPSFSVYGYGWSEGHGAGGAGTTKNIGCSWIYDNYNGVLTISATGGGSDSWTNGDGKSCDATVSPSILPSKIYLIIGEITSMN